MIIMETNVLHFYHFNPASLLIQPTTLTVSSFQWCSIEVERIVKNKSLIAV